MQLAKLTCITALFLLAVAPTGHADDHGTTLTGNFTSGFQDGPKTVRAVFTRPEQPGEERDFDVVFYFKFNGRDHQYRGTAWGSLEASGELEGRVQNESRQRTFTFRGEFEDGTFKGTHAEIGRRGERKTGQLTLRG